MLSPALAVFLAAACAAAPAVPAADGALAEMRARRVVAKDAASWTPEQAATLKRLRQAETMGALQFLRDHTGTLDGSAVELASDKGYKRLILTVEGHERFLFILSQEARQFFEAKGAEAKWVFKITALDGKRLFDDDGLLTPEGVDLYLKARRKLPVFWHSTDGRTVGTVRPPKEAQAQAPPAVLPKPPPAAPKPGVLPPTGPMEPPAGHRGPADQAATTVIDAMVRSGAVEISEDEARFLAQASGMSQKDLLEKSSLQAIPQAGKVRFFMQPNDPLMKQLGQYRKAQR